MGEKALLLVNGDGAITLPDAARRALEALATALAAAEQSGEVEQVDPTLSRCS